MRYGRVQVNNEHAADRLLFSGKTVVVTRRKEQAKEFSELLERHGARVILFPAVEVVAPPSWSECDAALEQLTKYSGIIFTSVNAVDFFFRRVKYLQNTDNLKRCLLYAVGEKTKSAIEGYGFQIERLPDYFSAEELARSLVQGSVTGKKYLFPKGNLARNEIVTILSNHGAMVDNIIVYHTQEPTLDDERRRQLKMIKDDADLITFFSPSSVVHFLRSLSIDVVRSKHVAVFGETTAEAAKHAGLNIDIIAPHSTINAFIEAIQRFYTFQHESVHAIKK